jgi:hypothetical protein
MQKSIICIVGAVACTILGFAFAKYCPLGSGAGSANAPSVISFDPSARKELITRVHTARAQIELYKIRHGGACPEFGKYGWKQLVNETDMTGQTRQPGKEFVNPSGPYLMNTPTNPLTKSSEVLSLPSIPEDFKASGTYGFVFDETNGRIRALTPDGKIFDETPPAADAR